MDILRAHQLRERDPAAEVCGLGWPKCSRVIAAGALFAPKDDTDASRRIKPGEPGDGLVPERMVTHPERTPGANRAQNGVTYAGWRESGIIKIQRYNAKMRRSRIAHTPGI